MMILGPIAIMLIETSMARGLRVGVYSAAGVALADTTFALTAYLGGSALVAVLEPVIGIAHVLAVAVLCWLGLRLVRGGWATVAHRYETDGPCCPAVPSAPCIVDDVATTMPNPGVAARKSVALLDMPAAPTKDRFATTRAFYGLTMVNPMTILAFMSLLVASGPTAAHLGWPIGVSLASVVVHSLMALLGASVGTVVSERVRGVVTIFGGCCVIAMSIRLGVSL